MSNDEIEQSDSPTGSQRRMKKRKQLKLNRRKAAATFALSIVAIVIIFVFGVGLKEDAFYIRKGEQISVECNVPFLNVFLKTGKGKEGKNEATLFFRKLPYTVTVLDFDESPFACRINEKVSLDTENLTKDAEITAEGGSIEEGKVSYEKAGTYKISVKDHGVTFEKEINVVNLEPVISLKPGEEYTLPSGEGEWTSDVKAENGVVKAEECGVFPYTYSWEGDVFSGNVYVTELPDNIGIPLGTKKKINLKGVKDETFTSSNTKIAKVNKNGTITAKKEGTCEIIAEKDGVSRTCHIMIKDIPECYMGDNIHTTEASLPESMEAKIKNKKIATVEDGTLHYQSTGETKVILKQDGYKFTIPVYVSSYENGNAKGYATKYQKDGSKATFTIFCQNSHSYRKYNKFMAYNGCSTCSLACVLSGYTDYQDPVDVIDTVEKQEVGSSAWNSHHHHGKDGTSMPMTLYGVNRCLNSQGVETEYVPTFNRSDMKADIWEALQKGQIVVIELNKKNQVTGKTDKYWSNSVHTVVLLGCFGDDGVYVGDPVNRKRGSGSGRIKESTLSSISQYMWSCSTGSPNDFYWNGKGTGGGYIKIIGKK